MKPRQERRREQPPQLTIERNTIIANTKAIPRKFSLPVIVSLTIRHPFESINIALLIAAAALICITHPSTINPTTEFRRSSPASSSVCVIPEQKSEP
jgi:hypothetical protein